MVIGRENFPLFFAFNTEIKANNDNHKQAVKELIARNPVFYKKTLFRAFLAVPESTLENMLTFGQEYLDYSIMLDEYLLLLHAPYMKAD